MRTKVLVIGLDGAIAIPIPPQLAKTTPSLVGDAVFFKSTTHHVLLKEMNRLMHLRTDKKRLVR